MSWGLGGGRCSLAGQLVLLGAAFLAVAACQVILVFCLGYICRTRAATTIQSYIRMQQQRRCFVRCAALWPG